MQKNNLVIEGNQHQNDQVKFYIETIKGTQNEYKTKQKIKVDKQI